MQTGEVGLVKFISRVVEMVCGRGFDVATATITRALKWFRLNAALLFGAVLESTTS